MFNLHRIPYELRLKRDDLGWLGLKALEGL
jgi:hypothetical protein